MGDVKLIPLKMNFEGKEVEIFIAEDTLNQIRELVEPSKNKTGYERVEHEGIFHKVSGYGNVMSAIEYLEDYEDRYYQEANYYSSDIVAANNARADKLMRQLRRFAVEHRKEDIDWNQRFDLSIIGFGIDKKDLMVLAVGWARSYGTIVFDCQETAELAIETFRDELIWYFTEYKDSL